MTSLCVNTFYSRKLPWQRCNRFRTALSLLVGAQVAVQLKAASLAPNISCSEMYESSGSTFSSSAGVGSFTRLSRPMFLVLLCSPWETPTMLLLLRYSPRFPDLRVAVSCLRKSDLECLPSTIRPKMTRNVNVNQFKNKFCQ